MNGDGPQFVLPAFPPPAAAGAAAVGAPHAAMPPGANAKYGPLPSQASHFHHCDHAMACATHYEAAVARAALWKCCERSKVWTLMR